MSAQRFLMVAGIILLAAATRLYHIDAQSIWFDEGWSAYAADQPTLTAAVEADPTNPPLYYVLVNLTQRAFGDSPFGLRLPSMLLGLLVIPLAYQLARRLFDPRAGTYAALLAGVSAPLWWASQEARMYTLLAVLVLIAALAWHQLLKKSRTWAWLALLLAELALLYAHNTGPIIVLWLNGVTLLVWLLRVSLRRPDWRLWIVGQIVVGLLWMPWLLLRFVEVQGANSAVASAPLINVEFLSRVGQALWINPWEMIGHEPLAAGLSAVAALLALLLIPWRQANARWLIVHVVALLGGLVAGLTIIGNAMHGRYLVMLVPLLLVAVGAGISRLARPALRYCLGGAFVALLLVNIGLAQNPLYQHDDARGMVQHYADTLTADDTVLAWSYADRYDLAYYWDRLGVAARRVTLPEGADWPEIAPLLPQTGRVALNIWYTQRADYRGMLPCVIGQGTINPPETFTTYGMSSLLYPQPSALPDLQPLERPVLRDGQPIAHVTGVGQFPALTADQALCVPVEVRVNQPLDVDLRAAVVLRNALGWDIVQESGIFATANQRTTSALDSGEVVQAFMLLRLPYGAPPGDYEVLLRVFDDQAEPSGYDMVAEDGPILGKDLPLGRWRVGPGADWSQVRRETTLPDQVRQPVSSDLMLLGDNIDAETSLAPGESLRLSLLWQGRDPLPDLILASDDGSWQARIPPETALRDAITLDWRELLIPSDAPGGAAALSVENGPMLGTIRIDSLPRIDEAPAFDIAVDQSLGDAGTLVGYTPGMAAADLSQPYPVTLIWQAGDATSVVSYTVFVQLLDSEGRLIAQSDSLPAQGARPTTGWREGEYIVDAHELRFNDLAAPGEAHLIAGMYDAQTGERVPVGPDGGDTLELPGTIMVR